MSTSCRANLREYVVEHLGDEESCMLILAETGFLKKVENNELNRTVPGGVLGVARTASSWREMPEEYGKKWETAYRWRYYELWLAQGMWRRILEALGGGSTGSGVQKPQVML